MKRNIVLISMAVLLILSACKTTKTIAKNEIRVDNPIAQTISLVQKNQPQFNTANVKMSMEVDMNERKLNVSTTCKMRKDSAIFVSFQVFGFEVFKAEMLPDSMKVFDKMNRRYYVADYSYFSKRFGVDVDFYSLQALLSAQLFCVGNKAIQADSCKIAAIKDGQFSIDYKTRNMLQRTELSASNVIQKVILKAINSNYELQTTYADYTNVNGISFPYKISLLATNEKSSASCNFSIQKVDFNTSLKFQSTSTEKLSRGNIDQILNK